MSKAQTHTGPRDLEPTNPSWMSTWEETELSPGDPGFKHLDLHKPKCAYHSREARDWPLEGCARQGRVCRKWEGCEAEHWETIPKWIWKQGQQPQPMPCSNTKAMWVYFVLRKPSMNSPDLQWRSLIGVYFLVRICASLCLNSWVPKL